MGGTDKLVCPWMGKHGQASLVRGTAGKTDPDAWCLRCFSRSQHVTKFQICLASVSQKGRHRPVQISQNARQHIDNIKTLLESEQDGARHLHIAARTRCSMGRFDVEALHLAPQGGGMHAHFSGCCGAVPLVSAQGFAKVAPLHIFKRCLWVIGER